MSTEADAPDSPNPGGLAVLAFRGPDAAKFLQGQLSADTEKLGIGASTLAGLHNPQGRVFALLHVTRVSPEEILAALPAELADPVAQRLRKYVLRSKVRIDRVDAGSQAGSAPRSQLDDIRQGLPQVYLATSEAFVAQMLNLDLLGAIAFDKGCYTGQEVIARAHYRGKVKRRMQRWRARGAVMPKPGDTVHAPDGRALTVVRAARGPDGAFELLAVGNFGTPNDPASAAPAPAPGIVVEGPLPLPYGLPDQD
jgi:folate-binding protein YgfZ